MHWTARQSTLLLCLALALLPHLLPGQPLPASAGNRVSVGVRGGERTAHATAVTFNTVQSVDGRAYQIGTAAIVVDDSSGTNAGWQLTVSVLPSNSTTAALSQGIVLAGLSTPQYTAGQQIDPLGGPLVPSLSASGDLRSPRTVLVSEPGFGKGTYRQELTVIRPLPEDPGARGTTVTLAVTIAPRS